VGRWRKAPDLTPVLVLKTGNYHLHHGCLGIVRSLGSMGVPVHIISESRRPPVAASRFLAGNFVWDTHGLSTGQLLEGLERIARLLNRPAVIIPTDDRGAILIAEKASALRRWFLFPRIAAALPRMMAEKQRLYALAPSIGVACPRAVVPRSMCEVEAFASDATFPVFVKSSAAWLNSASKTMMVRSRRELADTYRRASMEQPANLILQEHIPSGEDWFFHGYCNSKSECLASFTGKKLRSYPPHAGFTTVGLAAANERLRDRTEALLKAVGYCGIADIDYRLDPRDGQYKILDFNPRIGAQFALFMNRDGIDVARALYLDLTGERVSPTPQVDGRVFVVEPYEMLSSLRLWWRGELSLREWQRSLRGIKEFAWFRWNDPVPFVLMWAAIVARAVAKMLRGDKRISSLARRFRVPNP
jgi:D-aspartate ligase